MMLRDRSSAPIARPARKSRTSQVRLLEGLESRVMLAADFIGKIQAVDPGHVTGYAYDPTNPDTAATVALEVDGVVYGTFPAGDATSGVSFPTADVNHGFSQTTPTVFAGTHTISLVELSTDPNAPQTVVATLDTASFVNNAPTGLIQSSSGTNISGYAYDPDQSSTSLTVILEVDRGIVSTQTANIDQPALNASIGSTAHGFSFTIPALSAGSHLIEVYAVDPQTGVSSLVGSPTAPSPTVASLNFATQPASTNTNTTLAPIVVSLKDVNGTVVTSDASPVTLSIASGPAGGTIGGGVTAVSSGGQATFSNISFSVPGTYTLTATDGSLTATSTAFTIAQNVVNAPAPDPTSAKLLIKGQPKSSTTTSALTGPITVQVVNKKNKLVTTDESAVTLSIVSGPAGGALTGTTTVAAVNGVATFNSITLSGAGKYVLKATDAGLALGKSKPITVGSLPVVAMVITQQPQNVAANAAMAAPITVELLDRNNNVVTTAKGTVKLAIASGPAGAKLAGNSAPIKNGAANFSKLKIKTPGTYVLTVADGGLTLNTTTFTVA